MKNNLMLSLSLLIYTGAYAQSAPVFIDGENPAPSGKQWEAVKNMSDEFNGNAINLNKWQIEPNANSFNWIGRVPGLFQAKNVSVSDGNLRVHVDKLDQPFVGPEGTYTYSGGIVRSLKAGQPGWYYECRMKANCTEMSSTFWLLTEGGKDIALELDIQECVGKITPQTADWGRKFDRIFHSNCFHWTYTSPPTWTQLQGCTYFEEKNSSRYFVYGAWWKSADEIRFYLDGKYAYSIKPDVKWDLPAYLHMAIETYDWNPIPEDGGMVVSGTLDERTTKYDWIRTWKLVDDK